MQDLFAAHPRLGEQFPGGVVQFAQLAGHLPEDVLQEIMVNVQIVEDPAAEGALPHGEMPGGLPGDNLIEFEHVAEIDGEVADPRAAGSGEGGAPAADGAPPVPEEDEDEEDEDEDDGVEEVCTFSLPLLVVRAKLTASDRTAAHSCLA